MADKMNIDFDGILKDLEKERMQVEIDGPLSLGISQEALMKKVAENIYAYGTATTTTNPAYTPPSFESVSQAVHDIKSKIVAELKVNSGSDLPPHLKYVGVMIGNNIIKKGFYDNRDSKWYVLSGIAFEELGSSVLAWIDMNDGSHGENPYETK